MTKNSYMFRFNHNHQGTHYFGHILNSAPHTQTHTHTNTELIKYAAIPPNQPQQCILTDYFNNYNFNKLKYYDP